MSCAELPSSSLGSAVRASMEEPLTPGVQFCRSFAKRCGARMMRSSLGLAMTAFCRAMVQADRSMNLGTMCSGTDCPVDCLEASSSVIGNLCVGQPLPMHHVYSAEKNKAKREFLHRAYPRLPRLYRDMTECAEETAFCDKAGCYVEVEPCWILAAGFPCTTVSNLNKDAATASNRNTINSGSGATGSCFRTIFEYVSKKRPPVLILENVLGLLRNGQAEAVIETLKPHYHIKYYQLCTLQFGLPQDRRRIWFLGTLREATPDLAEAEVSEESSKNT